MLSIESCKKRILALENEIKAMDVKSPTEEQIQYIESLKRLKVAYAIEMSRAIKRRDNGEDTIDAH